MLSTRQLFLQHQAQTSPFPLALEIEKAKGSYLIDKNGKRYFDCISGIAVSSIGHCHPKVLKAIKEQSEKFMHLMVYGEFIQNPQVQLASALSALLPENLNSVYFLNSGSEAVEGAMKLAKRYTGRSEIISCIHGYHGSTQGALSIMGSEFFKQAFRPLLPDTKQITFNSLADIENITKHTACVVAEVIQGEAGAIPANVDFLQALREKCSSTGTLLVFDEIQTGFGRTGSMFAFEQYNVIPDILLLGKAMGGGMPISAFISSHEIMHSLSNNPILGHITTFGGHPVNCAAALATLEVLLSEDLLLEVELKSKLLKNNLVHPAIKSISGKGLMLGLEFESFIKLQAIIAQCIQLGVLTDWFLFAENKMRIAPPLSASTKELQDACDKINTAIEMCEKA